MARSLHNLVFRAKDKNGKWIFGDLIRKDLWKEIASISNSLEMADINVDTLGQFIGSEDVDGKNIYEGDIVELLSDKDVEALGQKYGIISYSGYMAAFTVDSEVTPRAYVVGIPFCEIKETPRVVGNIYDNIDILSIDKR